MDRKFDALTPHTGTEIVGLDLATATSSEIATIRRLLDERLVLVFRNQRLAREEHKALGRQFGTGVLHRYISTDRVGRDPEVLPIRLTAKSVNVTSAAWHADLSFEPNPLSTSLLYLLEAPEGGGGDTVFANMYLAYESLSERMKELLAGLTAIHDGGRRVKETNGFDLDRRPASRTEHPVVLTHPQTGRKLLWVNREFTSSLRGLSVVEGRHVLEALFQHIESEPALQCRVRWHANTLVMWDNLAVQYSSCLDYYPNSRYGEWVSSVGHILESGAAPAP
jgi:taurine dioxygenase